MGVWLHARLFAVSGTLAQIAWWWLLGTRALLAARREGRHPHDRGPHLDAGRVPVRPERLQSIGQLLGLAGPGLAACASVVAFVGVLVDPGWSAVIAALVIAVTATAALELQKVVDGTWVREASVVAFLPVPVAFLVSAGLDLPGRPSC